MTTEIKRLAPTQVELVIPIAVEDMQAAQDRAFRRLVKKAKLPGFRPGKVPRKIFEQNYGAQTIAAEAIEDVVPEVYAKAVREHDLEPVDRPKMELERDENGQPSRLKAVVEVRPDIALHEYKGLKLKRAVQAVTDEEVERSVQTLARERATLVPVEREARMSDVVTIDYEGTIDGQPFEGGSAKAQSAELQEGRMLPGFAGGIVGMKAGDSKTIDVPFPDDYRQRDLAGQTANFAITVHEVKEVELPQLDDAFAKAVSENETMEALRADIRRRLEAVAQARSRRELGAQAVARIVEQHEFPLPATLVDRELESMIGDAAAMAARMGVSFEDYLKATKKTEEQLREEYRPEAERRVRATLVLGAIAKAEKITATAADIQDELRALARQYGQPVDRVRKALGNNVLPLMDGIVRGKTVDFLVEHASIEEATAGAPS